MDEIIKQAREFLMRFKEIAGKRGIDIIPRTANNQALADLGLTRKNRCEEILSLSVEDYCEGPVDDNDRHGELWVFGRNINSTMVYVKLKIADVEGEEEKIAKCISFHEAQFPLAFPCKGGTGEE